ncbi:MAG TPA: thiamine pyrophosphate-dependent enzyme [Jiangellales bacterium]|nr:thiamine pyrophosphate-dependent enzyme [Jiangellales bacterium]
MTGNPLDEAFRAAVAGLPAAARARCRPEDPVRPGSRLTGSAALELFDAQTTSRQLDFAARRLQAEGRGFYTIGSSGHESNAALAAALRPTDPALLHYRSGAFYQARAAQVPGSTPVRDVLQGLICAADEPIAGGRHKVFGHAELSIIPQTSTIASHLPRAVGLAVSLRRAAKLGVDSRWPADSVVVCSFGDASANHSTATGAINTALQTAHQRLPVPVLFVCEDNGLGISVRTPAGWVGQAYGSRPGLRYFAADGFDVAAGYDTALAAAEYVRATGRPAFMHLRTVRFLGHAGSDAEISYRTPSQIEADYARDPLLGTATALVQAGAATPAELIERYDAAAMTVERTIGDLSDPPRLATAERIMAPLAPRRPSAVTDAIAGLAAAAKPDPESLVSALGGTVRVTQPQSASDRPEQGGLTLAASITTALGDLLAADQRVVVFGEDVGRKGGVYGVTRGLARRFGAGRVFDTLLDEQSILGLALGAGLAGLVPVPEIQYLAYLHNAEDQIRGEAATLSFFSQGQYRNPMIVRIAGLAYQKGFGGHFHNDNAVGVLRDIPGLVIACPARGSDAAAMLRTCWASAAVDGSVCVVLEPIAQYHARDLYEAGDGRWLDPYAGPDAWPTGHVPVGAARTYGDGADLTLATFGNGVPMSLRVARRLAGAGIEARVLDLRWLAPLPVDDIVEAAGATGRVLVVDETRRSGGVSEGVLAALIDADYSGVMARVTSRDSFVPLGPAAHDVLLSEDEIEAAAVRLVRGDHP